jgi:hypothetical protein
MKYLDVLRTNQFATFHNKRIVVQDICRLDRLLADALHGWRDPPALVPAMLLLRSHAAFRAGAGAAMAGQAAEAPCLLRLCLECAGYAAIIGEDQKIAEAFLRRTDSDAARREAQAAFNAGRIKAAVDKLDENLKIVFSTLYESLIDFGAHPNELMMTASSRMERRDTETILNTIYAHGDGLTLNWTLKRTVQVGLWSAKIFVHLFPSRGAEIDADRIIGDISSVY